MNIESDNKKDQEEKSILNPKKNLGIRESLYQAFDAGVLGYIPYTITMDLLSSVLEYKNLVFGSPYSSVTRIITSKFIRVFNEKAVIGNCKDYMSFNEIQKTYMCINEGSYEAVTFRATSAFVTGASLTLLFGGVPIVAILNGVNAVLYDATNELRKLEDVQNNEILKPIVEFVDDHSGMIFEGLDSLLKVKYHSINLLQTISSETNDRAKKLENANNIKQRYELMLNSKAALSSDDLMPHAQAMKVSLDEILNMYESAGLKSELVDLEKTSLHGFVIGAGVDCFYEAIRGVFDYIYNLTGSVFYQFIYQPLSNHINKVEDSVNEDLESENLVVAGNELFDGEL